MKPSSEARELTVADLALSLRKRGLTLSLRDAQNGPQNGPQLVLTGPAEQKTPKLLAYIRNNREAVIAWLQEDAAPRPDTYNGPIPEPVWNPDAKLGPDTGWEIRISVDGEEEWGFGLTKRAALAGFFDNLAMNPFPTESHRAAYTAAIEREYARLEAEEGTDAAPEIQPPARAVLPTIEADDDTPDEDTPECGGPHWCGYPVCGCPAPGYTQAGYEALLSWSGTTEGPSMPPIAFVPDVDVFWREYRARRYPAPYLDPTLEEVFANANQ